MFRSLENTPDTEVVFIGLNADGSVNHKKLEEALSEDTALVSIMHVNNEVGAINDLDAISALVKKVTPTALLHVITSYSIHYTKLYELSQLQMLRPYIAQSALLVER